MNRIFRCPHKLRALFTKASSALLMFQRAPLVKMLFPEARVLAGAGFNEVTKWTVATFAGLGAYDTVAGASAITQIAPTQGSTTVNAPLGKALSFTFQVTGTLNPAGSWTISGTLPSGLVHNGSNSSFDSITGTPIQSGTFPVTVTAWEFPGATGISLSKTFTINVAAPIIATSPSSTMVERTNSATLTVVGSGTALTYQWYRGVTGVTTNLIAGATSATYVTPPLVTETNFWVRVTRQGVTADSPTVTVSIGTAPAITAQPVSSSVASGATVTLTSAASGTSPTFQWYQGAKGDTTQPVAGATAATFTTPALTTTTSYWMRASNPIANADSNAAVITVGSAPTFTTQPASSTITNGATATLNVAVSGTAPTLQWYQGTAPDTTQPIAGATSASLTTPALTATTSYWVRATNTFGTVDSSTATVTVSAPDPFVAWQSAHFTAAQLSNAAISGPNADPDGDGVKNSDEYVFGTDPLVADASFAKIAATDSTHITVTFTAKAATGAGYEGKTRIYTLESSPALNGSDWTAITDFTDVVGTGQQMVYSSPVLHNRFFYHLKVTLTP